MAFKLPNKRHYNNNYNASSPLSLSTTKNNVSPRNNKNNNTALTFTDNSKMEKQIYLIMGLALILFLSSTLFMMANLPSPSSYVIQHSGRKPNVGHVAVVGGERRGGENVELYSKIENEDSASKVESAVAFSSLKAKVAQEKEERISESDAIIQNDNYKQEGNHDGFQFQQQQQQQQQQQNSNLQHKENESIQNQTPPNPRSNQTQSQTTDQINQNNANNNNNFEQTESPPAPNLIHILETRFMQNQPNLVQLAKARLQLFKAICLPTVIHQSAWGNFLWIIRTDPNLDEEIKQELIDILDNAGALAEQIRVGDDDAAEIREGKALTYVIGSNENYILANVTTPLPPSARPFDMHHMLSSVMNNPQYLFAGKATAIQTLLHEISSEKTEQDVILWTRLDADDGLNNGYMEYIQTQAIRYFLPTYYKYETFTDYQPPQWTYWCAGRNIDWFLTDPIHNPHLKNGTVYPVQHTNVCVTPGVTVALRGGTNPMEVPRLDHDKIISYLKGGDTMGELCGRKGLSEFDDAVNDDDGTEEEDDGSCFHMVNAFVFSAIRSRTPTSAGMLGITPTLSQLEMVKRQAILQPYMWMTFRPHFHIGNKLLVRTNRYFKDMVYEIAEENARGQCTEGHSCKSSSKDLLQQYVDLKLEMDGSFDIGHHGRIISQKN